MSTAKTDPLRGMVGGLMCVLLGEEPTIGFADERLVGQMGLPPAGTPLREIIPGEDWPALHARLTQKLADGGALRLTARLLTAPGEEPVQVGCSLCRQGQTVWAAISPTPDERMRGYEQMVGWYNGFRALLESAPQQAYEWDIEKRTLSEAGFQSALWRELMMSEPFLEVDDEGIPSAENVYLNDRPAFRQLHRSVLSGGAGGSVELRMRTGYGVYRWCRLTLATLYDDKGCPRRAVALLADIDEEKRKALAMAKRNERDPLTGLLGGEAVRERILTGLKKLQSGYLALYAVDIDHYQQVTDQLGNLFGEAVLIGAADKLASAAGEGAVLGRTGAITLVVAKPVESRRAAAALGRRFCEKLRQRFADGKQQLEVTASIGLVLACPGEEDYSALIRQADLALADAKRAGGGRLVTYRHGIPDSESLPQLLSTAFPSAAGSFNDNMFYLFFNMLYEGENPDRAIELVLRTAGQHFHASRAYIYEAEPEDNRVVRLTYEWCAEGVASRGEYMERFAVRREAAEHGRQRDLFRCDDARAPGALPDWLAPQMARGGVRAFLQSGLLDAGVYRGCIGFDDCAGPRIWSDEEQEILRQITRIVGGYLLLARAQERRSRQDRVTGLAGFSRFRKQAAALLGQGGSGWTLVSMDIVRFGRISSIFGEQIADRLLGRVGALIRDRLQTGEIACRVRRDEFALLLRQQPGETTADRAKLFTAALAAPARALLGHYDLQLVFGFCGMQPDGRITVSELYRRASMARLRAKQGGTGYLYYTDQMGAQEQRLRSIERQSARALDAGEFRVMLCPIRAARGGALCGLQARLRWKNPLLGEVKEEEYLPVFERSGFQLTLDLYLIRQVCALLARWEKEGLALPVTVRVSGLQLTQTNFTALLCEAADGAGVSRALLRLQLPGGGERWAGEAAGAALEQLRAAGFGVSAEQMGIHSVLAAQPAQPLCDEAVLPRSLLDWAQGERLLAALTETVHAMGARVRMAGLAGEKDLAAARRAGCDTVQGDALFRPLSTRSARALLQEEREAQKPPRAPQTERGAE